MADITATNLTGGGTETDATSYTTASISPTGDRLLLANVYVSTGNVATPTLSGNGLTWVLVETVVTATVHLGWTFRAMGASPSSGAVTIDFGGSTQARCSWTIDQFANMSTGGTDGSDAVVQSANTGFEVLTSVTVTLGAFGHADNATYGFLGLRPPQAVTEGSGFTQISEDTSGTYNMVTTELKATNDTTVDWSWGTNSVLGGAIGVEIKNASQQASSFIPQMIIS